MKKKKGFTLIELLIVLVIIGVITTLAVPQYQSFVIRIRGAEAMTNVRAIADSVWRHYLEAGNFPTSSATGPIPKELDVEVSGSSKYFSYSYYYQAESGNEKVAIIATDKDVSLNNRFGNIVRYFILYTKEPRRVLRGLQLHFAEGG